VSDPDDPTLPDPTLPEPPAPREPGPYWFCGDCGGLVPETAPALIPPAPAEAAACGQCGGPALLGGLTVPQYDRHGRYADPIHWPLCHLCAVIGRGPYSDAATLADILACRAPMPKGLALPLLAFRLSWEPVEDPISFPDTGWASFARRIGGLGPYCQVRADARVGDRPGPRWGHVPPASVWSMAADLEKIAAAREPIRHTSARPCCVCGAEQGPPRQWTVDALRGEPVCGVCNARAKSGRAAPAPPPGIRQAEALLPLVSA
jgi:hypothetical protein